MQAEDLEQLLRESDPVEAARLLAAMEPDEAVDALRDLPLAVRAEVLRHIPPGRRSSCVTSSATTRPKPAAS